jgi:septum formation inhibitor MinC
MGASVDFKANANGLVLVFDEGEPFESLCEKIAVKLESGGVFFKSMYLMITYRGRKLEAEEESKVAQLIAGKTGARTVIFEIDKQFLQEAGMQAGADGAGGDGGPAKVGGAGGATGANGAAGAGGAEGAAGAAGANAAAAQQGGARPGAGGAQGRPGGRGRGLGRRGAAPHAGGRGLPPPGDEDGFAFLKHVRMPAAVDLDECMTRFCKGTLRSGRLVSFDGNVVVLGDVNPGAMIEATGNVVVFGNLRGIVHSGAGGNKDTFVLALHFSPTQLRIADVIARRAEPRGGGKSPHIAHLSGGAIVVEPFQGHR